LCLVAVLAGAETFVDIALSGEKKLHLHRRLLPYANGTPPHDRLGWTVGHRHALRRIKAADFRCW
jgi:hypothetical protein